MIADYDALLRERDDLGLQLAEARAECRRLRSELTIACSQRDTAATNLTAWTGLR